MVLDSFGEGIYVEIEVESFFWYLRFQVGGELEVEVLWEVLVEILTWEGLELVFEHLDLGLEALDLFVAYI